MESNKKADKPEGDDFVMPWTYKSAIAFLMFVVSSGGYFAGYYVSTSPPQNNTVIIGDGFDDVKHTVTRVIDGDTFVIDGAHTVRMLSISAPELEQCYGTESKQYLSQLLLGQQVILQKDSNARDDVDRLLRYVFLYDSDGEKDNVFVNRLLLQEGVAVTDSRGANRKYETLLNVAMGQGRTQTRGLHSACATVAEVFMEPPSDECVIKGNVNDEKEKKYYFPNCGNYNSIKMRKLEGDEYFCSVQEAEQAGFEKSGTCRATI